MARQDINIGVEGNDGTGDSIRESFRKVNENFQEIYAIFGQGGSIAFTALSDTPDALFPNTIPLVNDSGSEIQLVTLASNSAIDETANDTITFTYSQAGKLIISTAFTKLRDDQAPTLGQPMYGGLNPIGGIAEPSIEAAAALNAIHNTSLTADDLVITKGFADRRYVSSGLPIRIADEPVNQDAYNLEVSRYLSSNVEILNHGYDTGINGTAFVFNSIYTDPQDLQTEISTVDMIAGRSYKIASVGLTDFTQYGASYNRVGEIFVSNVSGGTGNGRLKPVYFLRYVDENTLAVFGNKVGASFVSDSDAYQEGNGWIEIGATNIADDDVHTFTDASVDVNLEGNFLSDVAMPRRSIVRRQGDTMEGILTLSDHPGELSGFGTPNGADDLQAATKFYVDQSGYSSITNLYVSTDGDDRMIGVPPGKEGTSLQYAYRTIQKAAQRADEIIRTAPAEPGPYMQTVTRDNGADFAAVTFADIVLPVYENTRLLLERNREYLIKEVTGFIKWQFPNFVYNVDLCARDVGLMIDAIAYDINRGLNANYLSQIAAERYYSSVSGRYAITQQNAETVGSIQELRNLISAILSNTLYREKAVDSIALSGTAGERARVTTETDHGFVDGEQVVFKDMAGMVEIEGQTAYIKVISDQVFELYTDPDLLTLWDISAYTPYTTGGRCGRVYQDRVEDFNSIKETQFFYTPPGFPTQDDLDAKDAIVNPTSGKIQQIIRIINNLDDRVDVVYGSNYKIVLDNGSTNAYVDQANPDNTDTLPGKIMVGKISGAEGRIVKVTQNDGTENNNDSFEMIQLNGKDFVVGEPVEFGNYVKERQVTIIVEAGIYEEDYPIRIGSNVSLLGDDFRRCIIRPKRRVSQSKWADTYFFRDLEFDGITVATKGAPFYNQINELQGYFGRHYLTDVERPKNIGLLPSNNPGNFSTAAKILRDNKKFIQQEVLYYIDTNAQDILYNKTTCRRDLGLILDAVRYDAALGTNYNAVTAGLAYRRANNAYNLNYEQTYTLAAINEEKSQVLALTAVQADSTAFNRATNAFDEVVDIIENNTPDALTFPVPGSLPTANADDAATRLQNNRTFIQKEIIAWIADNYPLFNYSESPCERDVGYIVDALTYDILYGGNTASQTVARSYFEGTRNQLGVGETETTIEAYGRLKEVVDQVVRGVTVTVSPNNVEVQDTSGTSATAIEGNALQALIEDNIITVLEDGTVGTLPNVTYPNLGWVAAATRSASDAINSNSTTIINNVITFLDGEISGNFIYDTAKCARDVGLIIDALALDFERGGAEYSLETQGQYYTNYILAYDASPGTPSNFGGQATITSAAIGHIATLAGDLFDNITPAENAGVEADISNGFAEAGTPLILGELVDLIRFAFGKEYNPPKRNDENGVDVFLMGDASRIANCTVQGHAGFMCVLDPDGQILTKSPYIQVGSSFSKSDNEKRFRGGMYVDAYTGNIPAYIPQNIVTPTYSGPGKVNNLELWIQSELGQGLFVRPPQLPCPFYVDGRRYQVNAISDYDSGNGWCKIYLDSRSNDGDGYDETQFDDGEYARNIFLQTAGNRSMLGNDFTQINDLGYALVCNNGALSEMVSMFTYYCQVAYYAKNGSEIRSTAGSNGYGNFGLVAEGADPNEIPDQVTLRDPMAIPAKAYTSVDTPNAGGDPAIYVTDMRTPPTANSLITIDHGGSVGTLNYIISAVQNMSDLDNDGIDGNGVDDIVATGGVYSNRVYKLDIRGDDDATLDFFPSLKATVPNGTYIEFRHDKSQIFEGVLDPAELKTRPSTAINFDESDDITYRTLSFANADAFSYPLPVDEILAGLEVGYEYIQLEIDTGNLTGGYGSAAGDTKIAVKSTGLTPKRVTQLLRDISGKQPGDVGYAGGMIFTWKGKSHRVVDYTEGAFNYITIEDAGTNITGVGGVGLSTGIPPADKVLQCGLDAGATAEITIKISLVRATGHDFTQIGTGGYNTSNYPNVIYGPPTVGNVDDVDYHTDASTATSAQVWERRKGRVFWMSTDQNGWFRVGKFFSVDQGTGDINIGGNIGISGATSLGFLRGVTVNEFSADDSFSDFSGTAVPTERAVGNFINRVLGWNVQSGVQIQAPATGNRIGPGFLPLSGQSQMEGTLDMGNNVITNVSNPGTDGTAAANKNYVDAQVSSFDQLEDLRNTELNSVAVNDLFVATGKKRIITTPISGGVWTTGQTIQNGGATKTGTVVDVETSVDPIEGNINIVTYTPVTGVFGIGENLTNGTATATVIDGPIDEWANAALKKTGLAGSATFTDIDITVERAAAGTTINFQHVPDSIKNADVNSAAAIAQSKLAMQNANTFDESDATNGWNGTATKVQSDLGLAKFSDENFETSSGYVRIKNGGIIFAELQDIEQYKLYGRQSSGSGDPEEVAYSDAIKYGGGLEDRDFNNSEWTETSNLTKLVFTNPVTVSNGNRLEQNAGAVFGTVQGDVYLGNIVYLTAVTGTFSVGNGAVTNVTAVPNEDLGTPTTATVVNNFGKALIKTDDGYYATTTISTGTTADTIVRRNASGKINASVLQLDGYDILDVSGTTLVAKTPAGDTFLTAPGPGKASGEKLTTLDIAVRVGAITNNTTNDKFGQSEAQANTTWDDQGFLGTNWVYTNFIEALSESGDAANTTTGIGLGAGNGYTSAGANTVVVVTDGTTRLAVSGTSVTVKDVNGVNKFSVTASNGNTSVGGTLGVSGATTLSSTLTVTSTAAFNGNVDLGNATSDTITFTGRVDSTINPNAPNTLNLGALSLRWNTVYATTFNGVATEAKYADLAEKYVGDEAYQPGTVLVFGGDKEVTVTNAKGDRRVAGVVSTNPAYLMNSELDAVNTVSVALAGRVPCNVLGRVQKGDLLVTSAIPGYAVVDNEAKVGTVIGKALESKDTDGKGTIEIVVGRA